MSTKPHRRYTLEEYFDIERSSEEKYEFFDGEIFAMSGASLAHEQIVANVIFSLRTRLSGRSCLVPPHAGVSRSRYRLTTSSPVPSRTTRPPSSKRARLQNVLTMRASWLTMMTVWPAALSSR
jgi:hypothetical protein